MNGPNSALRDRRRRPSAETFSAFYILQCRGPNTINKDDTEFSCLRDDNLAINGIAIGFDPTKENDQK